MNPKASMGGVIYTGDALEILLTLGLESVQCVITSPPYYGLRDYGLPPTIWDAFPGCEHEWGDGIITDGRHYNSCRDGNGVGQNQEAQGRSAIKGQFCQDCGAWRGSLGLEPTPELYVSHLVQIFRGVRRVLRDDGCVFLNLGDSYAGSGGGGGGNRKGNEHGQHDTMKGKRPLLNGLKPKDLIGIPWLVAKALQAPYYTGRIKAERDRIYLAATIDAEGTICGFTHKRKDSGDIRRGIHMTVTNSNIRMLDECYRIWKTSKQDHNAHGKGHLGKLDTFRWVAHDLAEKQQLLAELYPYFICKQKQALLAWNFLEISKRARGRNKGTEGDENREKSAWVVHSLSRLNHLESVDIPSWIKEPPSQLEPGWFLRQDCIWSKPNCMPESVKDRCCKSHEYVFLLTKSARYYFDGDAIKEDAIGDGSQGMGQEIQSNVSEMQCNKGSKNLQFDGQQPNSFHIVRAEGKKDISYQKRTRRSVWTITTKPFKEAHFATFPPEIPEICIKAGTSERGCCPKCGSPWERVVQKSGGTIGKGSWIDHSKEKEQGMSRAHGPLLDKDRPWDNGSYEVKTTGWRPTCTHYPHADEWREYIKPKDSKNPTEAELAENERIGDLRAKLLKTYGPYKTIPCTVLDPFGGAHTTGMVAEKLDRKYIGIDLSREYNDMGEARIEAVRLPLFTEAQ